MQRYLIPGFQTDHCYLESSHHRPNHPPTRTNHPLPTLAAHRPSHTAAVYTRTNECSANSLLTRSKSAFRPKTWAGVLWNSPFRKAAFEHTAHSSFKKHQSCSAIWHSPVLSLGVAAARSPLALAGWKISEGDATAVQREGIARKFEAWRASSKDACHRYHTLLCMSYERVINTHHCSLMTRMDKGVKNHFAHQVHEYTVFACKWAFCIQGINYSLLWFDSFHKLKKYWNSINVSVRKYLYGSVQLFRKWKHQNP